MAALAVAAVIAIAAAATMCFSKRFEVRIQFSQKKVGKRGTERSRIRQEVDEELKRKQTMSLLYIYGSVKDG
jgi:hypothetical protein